MLRLIGLIALVAVALTTAGCGGGSGTSTSQTLGYLGPLTTNRSLSGRPCGHVTAGRKWKVTATSTVACRSARRLVTAFYAHKCPVGSANHPHASCAIAGYNCLEAPPTFKGGFIWCINIKTPTHSVRAT
jgi:hypothetical protein